VGRFLVLSFSAAEIELIEKEEVLRTHRRIMVAVRTTLTQRSTVVLSIIFLRLTVVIAPLYEQWLGAQRCLRNVLTGSIFLVRTGEIPNL